jgi:hypothetical protein
MPVSQKKRTQVREAIRASSMSVMAQFMPPDWTRTPPEVMDAADRRVFDAITEFEVKASRLADQALAGCLE